MGLGFEPQSCRSPLIQRSYLLDYASDNVKIYAHKVSPENQPGNNPSSSSLSFNKANPLTHNPPTVLSFSLPALQNFSKEWFFQYLNFLSDSKLAHPQWIPGHSSFPGNNSADTLLKAGASHDLPSYHFPSHLLFPFC